MKTETKVKQIMIILDLKQFKGALLVKRDSHCEGRDCKFVDFAQWWILFIWSIQPIIIACP